MILLEGVSANGIAAEGPPSPLRALHLACGAGVHAIVSGPTDGGRTLLDVVSGRTTPTAGRVTVLGVAPHETRGKIAHVALDAALPDALRVDETCDLAADLAGEARRLARERLAVLGIEALATRKVSSLDRAEARSVAFAIALTSAAPVLLVDEPLALLAPEAMGRVVPALRARATAGACVVVVTSSVRDATLVGDRTSLLTEGTIAALSPSVVFGTRRGARIRVFVGARTAREARAAFLAALAESPAVGRIEAGADLAPESTSPSASIVVVSGTDLAALARAVTRALASSAVDVDAIEPAIDGAHEIRAVLAAARTPLSNTSPPPGSLPPGSARVSRGGTLPPGSLPPASPRSRTGTLPPPPSAAPPSRQTLPPASVPPPSLSPPPGSLPPGSMRGGGT